MEDKLPIQDYIQKVREISSRFEMKHGRPPICHTHAYGCQQNVSDGERINGMLLEMGYQMGDDPSGADLVLYLTCAVRENAEDRVFGNVGALKKAKCRNPDMIVGLCGCMVQQEHIAAKIKGSFPYVDLLFGPSALPEFPRLLHQRLEQGGRVFELLDETGDIVEGLPVHRDGSVKAWIPIMYGCNNFCTYCVVPFVRGRERSRRPEQILTEARGLIHSGYREITLLGQNVNSYDGGMNFAALLREINQIPGEFRIRFMTSHPKDCTRELIDTIAACDKVCGHIHLPVQSGSDRILTEMNRRYTSGQYRELIAYAKERIPGVTLTSDIIVGFPGETDEDFRQTLKLIQDVEYQSLFTFLYSPRAGTKAAEMEDPVPREEKVRRFELLLKTQGIIGNRHQNSYIGKTVRVLVDGTGKTGDNMLTGRNESNIIVEFPGSRERIGSFVDVTVTSALKWALLGEMIQ